MLQRFVLPQLLTAIFVVDYGWLQTYRVTGIPKTGIEEALWKTAAVDHLNTSSLSVKANITPVKQDLTDIPVVNFFKVSMPRFSPKIVLLTNIVPEAFVRGKNMSLN